MSEAKRAGGRPDFEPGVVGVEADKLKKFLDADGSQKR
jgi:hypothetical protein